MKTLLETFVVPNLSHSTTYQVRVRGVSVVGRYRLFGEWSEETSTAGIAVFHCNSTLNITILINM